MNRRSFMRLLGLAPVYAVGAAVLFKSLPAPAAKYKCTEYVMGFGIDIRNPHAAALAHAMRQTRRMAEASFYNRLS